MNTIWDKRETVIVPQIVPVDVSYSVLTRIDLNTISKVAICYYDRYIDEAGFNSGNVIVKAFPQTVALGDIESINKLMSDVIKRMV